MPPANQRSVTMARRAAMRKQLKNDRQFLRVLEIGWNYVLFRYGGYKLRFEYHQGRLCRNGGDCHYLQPEDYELLFDWAEMLLKARNQAAKNNRPTRTISFEPGTAKQLAWHF